MIKSRRILLRPRLPCTSRNWKNALHHAIARCNRSPGISVTGELIPPSPKFNSYLVTFSERFKMAFLLGFRAPEKPGTLSPQTAQVRHFFKGLNSSLLWSSFCLSGSLLIDGRVAIFYKSCLLRFVRILRSGGSRPERKDGMWSHRSAQARPFSARQHPH